jgi:hypothetical protein
MAIFSVTKFSVSYWIYLQPVIAKEGLDSYSCVVHAGTPTKMTIIYFNALKEEA